MNVITKNVDSNPYTGVREVVGKVRVLTENEASWLNGYFNSSENYEQVSGLTRGKEYDVIRTEGFGDCEDITIIDDTGNPKGYGSFFFSEVI